MYELA